MGWKVSDVCYVCWDGGFSLFGCKINASFVVAVVVVAVVVVGGGGGGGGGAAAVVVVVVAAAAAELVYRDGEVSLMCCEINGKSFAVLVHWDGGWNGGLDEGFYLVCL